MTQMSDLDEFRATQTVYESLIDSLYPQLTDRTSYYDKVTAVSNSLWGRQQMKETSIGDNNVRHCYAGYPGQDVILDDFLANRHMFGAKIDDWYSQLENH